jgi:uncharacterized protein (DUF1800 family)
MKQLPKWMRGVQAFVSVSYQSGFRYTPQQRSGENNLGRPLYDPVLNQFLEERATPWFNADVKLNKTFYFKDAARGVTLSLEGRNVLNNRNAQIINPVTGRAYEEGDDVPNNWRDPRFIGPEESGAPPNNPARFLAPRQVLIGVRFRF